MDHCEICEQTLEIGYTDASQGPTIPNPSGFICEHGGWVRTFAPLPPFAYRKAGDAEWRSIADGSKLNIIPRERFLPRNLTGVPT